MYLILCIMTRDMSFIIVMIYRIQINTKYKIQMTTDSQSKVQPTILLLTREQLLGISLG
jgi:hypothetical protein